MQDKAPISGAEASAWLRKHFAHDGAPEIDITWTVGESSPTVYREVMDILFGPQAA